MEEVEHGLEEEGELEEEELKEEIYLAKEQDMELEEEQLEAPKLSVMLAQNSRIMDRGSVS